MFNFAANRTVCSKSQMNLGKRECNLEIQSTNQSTVKQSLQFLPKGITKLLIFKPLNINFVSQLWLKENE